MNIKPIIIPVVAFVVGLAIGVAVMAVIQRLPDVVTKVSIASSKKSTSATTPIFIDVNASGARFNIAVNDVIVTSEQLEEILQTNKAQFGGSDPIYIRTAGDVSLNEIFALRDAVKKTHFDIHLIVIQGELQKEMRLFDPDLNLLPSSPSNTPFPFHNPPNPMLHLLVQPVHP